VYYVGPTGSPQNVTAAVIQSFNATITWEEVRCSERNGQVTGYQFSISSSEHIIEKTIMIESTRLSYAVSNLRPLTRYMICIKAIVIGTTGPCGSHSFTTISNSKLKSLHADILPN
jgi:hypothetical protein